jgi:hypothetical protein
MRLQTTVDQTLIRGLVTPSTVVRLGLSNVKLILENDPLRRMIEGALRHRDRRRRWPPHASLWHYQKRQKPVYFTDGPPSMH